MNRKRKQHGMKVATKLLAKSAYEAAKVSANTGCFGPLYEPEQPKELERFKKKY